MLCSSLRVVSRGLGRVPSGRNVFKRNFLSPAFQCQDSWKERLESPLLKKCMLEDFYFELENKHGSDGQIAAIDVDIFVNAMTGETHLDEMQDIVHKLRLSREACNVLPSTHHGVIRLLLECKKYEDLMTILNDRLNYGIFPDDYSSLLLFDVFLKSKNYKNAAKVASLQMFQEDFSHPLIRYLSLYSCHNYLLNPTEWEKAKEEVPPPEDEEEVKVRVAYLRNPFFDDHFDLVEANSLIGKTLVMISQETNDDISRSYKLLGHILFEKFPSAQSHLESILSNNQTVHKDVFDLISKSLEETKAKKPEETSDSKAKSVELLLSLCQDLVSNKLVSDNQVLPLIEDKIKQLVSESENNIISQQQSIYKEWMENRERILTETLDELKKEQRLAQVQQVKEDLLRKEEQLFFFDREDELDLRIEKKEEMAKEENRDRGQTSTKSASTSEYVPPDIVKQKRST